MARPSFPSAMTAEETDASQANAHLVSVLYDAFVIGDIDAAARFVAPDYVLHVPGRGLNAGEYWGIDGFRQFMSNIARHNGGIFQMDVPVCAVSGEHAFTREVVTMNRAWDPHRVWELRISNWLKLRGGKLSESWVIPEDQRSYDEYWTIPSEASSLAVVAPSGSPHRLNVIDVERAVSAGDRELLAAMYDRFWSGDPDGMRQTVADDVIVNIVGKSAMSDLYQGWEGYMQFRDRLMDMAGPKYKLDLVALAASEGNAFAVEYIRMNRCWDPTVREIWVLMHFEIENERIARMNDFPLDTYAWEEFYTPPTLR